MPPDRTRFYGRSLRPVDEPDTLICAVRAKLVQKCDNLQNWDTENDVLSLLDVVRNVKPDIPDRGFRPDRALY